MHEYFSNFKKFIILKKIMWKKNFIWWKTSSFLGKIFNGKILRFFRQKWPLFWSKFLYFGYPENISGFRVLNVGFRVGFGYRPLGFGSGSGGLKCRVYPSGFRVFGSPDTSLQTYQPYVIHHFIVWINVWWTPMRPKYFWYFLYLLSRFDYTSTLKSFYSLD